MSFDNIYKRENVQYLPCDEDLLISRTEIGSTNVGAKIHTILRQGNAVSVYQNGRLLNSISAESGEINLGTGESAFFQKLRHFATRGDTLKQFDFICSSSKLFPINFGAKTAIYSPSAKALYGTEHPLTLGFSGTMMMRINQETAIVLYEKTGYRDVSIYDMECFVNKLISSIVASSIQQFASASDFVSLNSTLPDINQYLYEHISDELSNYSLIVESVQGRYEYDIDAERYITQKRIDNDERMRVISSVLSSIPKDQTYLAPSIISAALGSQTLQGSPSAASTDGINLALQYEQLNLLKTLNGTLNNKQN